MLSARQLLLMRRARDRAIGIAVAPLGAIALLPDPDFWRRVWCVSHVVARSVGEWTECIRGIVFIWACHGRAIILFVARGNNGRRDEPGLRSASLEFGTGRSHVGQVRQALA